MRRDPRPLSPESCGAARALGWAMLWTLMLFACGLIGLGIAWGPAL